MKFSHLIQINDPLNPLIGDLSREQVWRGMVLRAENPALFVMALDEFRILERGDNALVRELRFGQVRVRDRVSLEPMRQVRYAIEAGADLPAASLVMSIEEPQPGQLFVRFDYEIFNDSDSEQVDELYARFARQAYTEADIDTIAAIRRLAEEGELNSA